MNPGMPSSGMPSGASSGAPYFNGWSPYGGFAQPQQNYGGYGFSSPYGGMNGGFGSPYGGFGSPFGSPYGGFGGFGGGYGMSSPFGGFGGGYGMPFQQMPMGGGKGGYSSPFSQFQTPNFAAKGGQTQLPSPGDFNSLQSQQSNTQSSPGPMFTHHPGLDPLPPSGPGGQPAPASPPFGPPLPGNQPQQPATGLPQPPLTGSIGGFGGTTFFPGQSGTTGPMGSPQVPSPQPNAPIPQAIPPQIMNPVSGPAQMLPQQMFNQTRIPGANSVLPGRNMLIGGYR